MEDNPTVTGEYTGRYTIERELGRGGAAIVYLARDNRQERHVALKVLHRELAQAIGAQRFLREIKHSSALQHPHLLTILDSGESRGTLYYVMPYMADGSLRTRIAKEKQLPIDEAVQITRDVGEALAYAHSRGIVHRDIKPDNVLFSENHACLADFGIARAVDSVAADTLTSTGLVVGTPAYMSPEQASGEKKVDARSDQYSLACLLYEMITGLPPFIGATQQSVISQRFTQPPPSMRVHRPAVPEHVERAVKRAMAVVPADRFASVPDFIAALHEPGAATGPVSVHSIRRRWFGVGAVAAVVTLAVIAAKPGAEWVRSLGGAQVDTSKFVVLPFLSDADSARGVRVGAAIHAGLARWEGLALEGDLTVRDAVRARGSVKTLRDAYAVARNLGAGRLIWGHVADGATGIIVHADLYDVASETGLGERRLSLPDGNVSDTSLFALASALLPGGAMPRGMDSGERGTTSYGAWQSYRLGAAALASWNLAAADAHFAQAIAADPDFAVAQYWAARVGSWLRRDDPKSWDGSAARAVALKRELLPSDVARAEALLAFANGEYPVACAHYRQLAERDRLDAGAWYGLGECLHADAVIVADRSAKSGFRFRSSWHSAGTAFLRALELDRRMHAIPQFRRMRQLFPTEPSRVRQGLTLGPDSVGFVAYPEWVGDSLAFNAIPETEAGKRVRSSAEVERQGWALERNQRVLRSLATTWATTYPRNQEAHLALATILEVSVDLDGALTSLAKARTLPGPELDQLAAAEAEVRVRLKKGDFQRARLVADSVLARFEITQLNWEPLARLAGLAGRVDKLALALVHYWDKFTRAQNVDPMVAARAAELLAHASIGQCGPRISPLSREVDASIQSRVQPHRHPEIRERVANASATFLMNCTKGRSMANVDPGSDQIGTAQRAYARGDRAAVRTLLDRVAENRLQRRPGDVSVSLIARESWLRLALGDTIGAVAIVDATLGALPTISSAVLSHPLEYAILVSTMVARADIAVRQGDVSTARKWGAAVAELWKEAHPAVRPTVERMRRLAALRLVGVK